MSAADSKSPAEKVLDVTVYAPLGLALAVSESFPDLVRKGRSRLGPQIGLARTVGQFAVHQGFRQFRGLVAQRPPFPFWNPFGQRNHQDAARAATKPSGPADNGNGNGNGRTNHSSAVTTPTTPRSAPRTARAPGAARDESLAAAHLAIPSYDTLSASQVVQRLAGLSREEVEAVRAYEAATRGRRTILARAEQLLA
jgi:hypothetical protein